jgi:elongation factor 1 alpha-like protein
LSGVNIIIGNNTTTTTNATTTIILTDEERQLRNWYDGPTVVQALDAFDVPPWQQSTAASLERPLRLIVADVVEGSNAISIRAKIVAGWVKQGEKLILLPVGDVVSLTKVQSVHYAQSSSVTTTTTNTTTNNRTVFGSGELIDATITGLSDAQRIGTGAILARPQQRPPLARRCKARLYVLDNVSVPIIRGATVVFHLHHLDLPCSVAALLYTLEPDGTTVRKHRPRALSKNTSAVVELQLLSANPICMEPFVDCRALGRFVLRRGGDSVAVGRIEQVLLG